jgi:carbon-monoxide dehydrogenase small subunit
MNVRLSVNGQPIAVDIEPRLTLADLLRDRLDLTGTHLGCEHGACGACTVLIDGRPVRSCLIFAVQCEGVAVTTVEGLSTSEGRHPVQTAFARNAALQCGFCTPGFVTMLAGALDADPHMSEEHIEELVSSNICRCTGYRSILAAALEAAEKIRSSR